MTNMDNNSIIGAPSQDELYQLFAPPTEVKPEEALSVGKELEKSLLNKYKNLFDVYSTAELQSAFTFAEDYKSFLDHAKTEREAVYTSIKLLNNLGFSDIRSKEQLLPGDKVYRSIHNKGLMAAVIGEDKAKAGFNILGAHVDSPRFDLKPNPIYEEAEMVFLKTHYYGGVKKYQWTAVPLALHGFAVRADGTSVKIAIGDDENDPVFMLTDLLIHLSKDQMTKTAAEVVTGEELNLLIGGRPVPHKDVSERFKVGFLMILKEKYGLSERDIVSAEIQVVPSDKARDLGFDRSFIAAYGHDDRVCAYPALRAVAAQEKSKRTVMLMLTDKEEVGSQGNTGAQSQEYETFMAEVYAKTEGGYDELGFLMALENSAMLSTDVVNGYDPNFASTMDIRNNSMMGHGVCLQKYTGSRGKSGASDANAEFLAKVVHLLDEYKIPWQTGELGKVDQGGGGTISQYAANRGIEVLDCGVPVLNMHAPQEIVHKLDLYATHQAYRCFIENM